MKNINQIKAEITNIMDFSSTQDLKQYRKDQRELRFLNECIKYLETNPSEEFVHKMFESTEKKLLFINENYGNWCNNNPDFAKTKNPKGAYYTEMNRKSHLLHKKTLKYILSS